MEQMIERITRAVRNNDKVEVERIVHQLITIGVCDQQRALAILERR